MAVYMMNESGGVSSERRDYSGTLQFGSLHRVNKGFVQPRDTDEDGRIIGQLFHNIETAAKAFDPARDYLLPLGDMAQVLQFVALVVSMQKDHPIRILKWDKHEQAYYVVKLMQFVMVPV